MAETNQRYTAVAIVLHWAIAFAILFNIPLGLWMHGRAEANEVSEGVFRAFQLHKSIGLTVLALSLIRIGWRLTHAQPPLPAHMPTWEKRTARATHFLFYALMLALPLDRLALCVGGLVSAHRSPAGGAYPLFRPFPCAGFVRSLARR